MAPWEVAATTDARRKTTGRIRLDILRPLKLSDPAPASIALPHCPVKRLRDASAPSGAIATLWSFSWRFSRARWDERPSHAFAGVDSLRSTRYDEAASDPRAPEES